MPQTGCTSLHCSSSRQPNHRFQIVFFAKYAQVELDKDRLGGFSSNPRPQTELDEWDRLVKDSYPHPHFESQTVGATIFHWLHLAKVKTRVLDHFTKLENDLRIKTYEKITQGHTVSFNSPKSLIRFLSCFALIATPNWVARQILSSWPFKNSFNSLHIEEGP